MTLTTCDGKHINAHWSDDPRFTSRAHFDAVKAGTATLTPPDTRNDRGGIDYSAQQAVPLYALLRRRGD